MAVHVLRKWAGALFKEKRDFAIELDKSSKFVVGTELYDEQDNRHIVTNITEVKFAGGKVMLKGICHKVKETKAFDRPLKGSV